MVIRRWRMGGTTKAAAQVFEMSPGIKTKIQIAQHPLIIQMIGLGRKERIAGTR
jgi:hypothetical protein